MAANNLTDIQVHYKNLLPANIEVKLSEDNLAQDLLKTTAPVCWSCENLCKEAYTTDHPCIICSECRNKCLKDLDRGSEVNCPCKATCVALNIFQDQLQSRHYIYEKTFKTIEFFCPNKDFGCGIQLLFDEMEEHVRNTCFFDQRSCKFCGVKFMKCLLEEHENNECERRIIECELCGIEVEFKDKDCGHKNINNKECCKKFFDICPYCRDVSVTRDEFIEHLTECTAMPRFCCFNDLGCEFFDKEYEVVEHEAAFYLEHQKLLLISNKKLTIENAHLKQLLEQNEDAKNKEFEEVKTKLKQKDESNKKELEKLRQEFMQKEGTIKKDFETLQKLTMPKEQFKKILTENEQTERNKNEKDFEKLRNEVMQREEVNKKEFEGLRKEFQEIKEKVKMANSELEQAMFGWTKVDLKTITLELMQDGRILRTTSMKNNQRIWILDRVSDKRKKDEALYSPFWCTAGGFGYKFRLLLYLEGIRDGKGTHLSLYVQIGKGENDRNIQWPCPLTFTVEIVKLTSVNDLSPVNLLCNWATAGDRYKKYYNRPTSDVNTGTGTSRILTHEEAFSNSGEFVLNDKMVFRVTYDKH